MSDGKKVVQFAVKGKGEDKEITVLCDDGSMYVGAYFASPGETPYPLKVAWTRLPPVPAS